MHDLLEAEPLPIQHIYRLSDLSQEDFSVFCERFSAADAARRQVLVRHMVDLSEENFVVDFTPFDAIDVWCRLFSGENCPTTPGSHYHLTAFTANNTVKDKDWQEGMVLLDDTSDFYPYDPATYNGDNIIQLGHQR
jgi:hypothetical protein